MSKKTIELLKKWATLAPDEALLKEMLDDGERFWILMLPVFGQRFTTLLDEFPTDTELAYFDTLILGAVTRAVSGRNLDFNLMRHSSVGGGKPFDFEIEDGAVIAATLGYADGTLPGMAALTAYVEYLEGLV